MKKSRFTDEQIIGFLRQVEAGMSFSTFAGHWEKTNTSVNHNIADATPISTSAVSNNPPKKMHCSKSIFESQAMHHVSGIFQCALTVFLALMVTYPTSAQPTDGSDQAFKFCMGQCTANSCSGPASVVEKNCTRKCMSAAPSSSSSHDYR